jgi:hypothetical protein
MTDVTIATAADYADALITARRAKNWLFLLLFVMLLVQLGTFLAARYTHIVVPTETTTSTTQSTFTARDVPRYIIGISDFAGITLSSVLSMVLLLIVLIMVVGRTLGVSGTTSAYVWSLLLIMLLFPWQAFLDPYSFKVPGVLYTWRELRTGAQFTPANIPDAIVRWSRFVVFPVLALVILLIIQVQTTRGMKLALGEEQRLPEPHV